MQIYLYPFNSLDDLQAALHSDCETLPLFEVDPQNGQQGDLTQVNVSEVFAFGTYVQDYFSLANYVLLYEVEEADPCESTSK